MKLKLLTIIFLLIVQTFSAQFITTWQTFRDNQEVTIPIHPNYTYDYTVDWGDGSVSSNQTGDATHTYAVKGTYTVSITGTFPAIYIDYSDARSSLKTVEQWGNNPWKSMERAFFGCTNFRVLATDVPDLSNVTDMSYMFSAINLNFDSDDDVWYIPNIENWDVSNVTKMGSLFNFLQGFNQDISGWDVSKVTDMSFMFRILRKFNQDISGWDVSNVTNMAGLFDNASSFNQDISGWNVSKVTDMKEMFENATNFNQDISGWDVSNVTNMSKMFDGASSFNQDISGWNVAKVTNMESMFKDADSFNQSLGSWNISNVIDMDEMLDYSNLSVENYDATLIGWANQTLQQNVTLGADNLYYCTSETARTTLMSAPNNWTISDEGKSASCNSSPTTLIPDTNFEQYLIDENIDSDATLNGQVFTADIENIDKIVVKGKNISDLTGMEDFTNLVELDAANNQITNIDLSKNLFLENLFIANNQLTTIDLSKNTKLKKLDVGENSLATLEVNLLTDLESLSCYKNQLTMMNLISNQKLISFIANENQLTNVDVRTNTNLIWLDVDDNNLSSLTVKNTNNSNFIIFSATGNSNLTCIEVDNVAYSETNWTNKDATANFSGDCAPANDDCAFAIPLVIGQETPGDINSGNFTNATDCVAGTVIADVWYSITIPDSGEFSVQGSGLGGLLKFAVYESCASTSAVSCGINISLTNLTPGDTYYLRVWMEETSSSSKSSEFGTFTLTASESSVLSTDNFTKLDDLIVVYPNPASSSIQILSNQNINTIEIFSALGKRVLQKTSTDLNKKNIDVSDLADGVYLVKINNKQIKKLIIN